MFKLTSLVKKGREKKKLVVIQTFYLFTINQTDFFNVNQKSFFFCATGPAPEIFYLVVCLPLEIHSAHKYMLRFCRVDRERKEGVTSPRSLR